ncbi:hypothetical protein Mth01_38310 [Sphaerimonospora thailandensis]|uniref:Uncharacterized protein n=1 Tax=Sphaerimonospora thailandensis TaxID=795644 RepID=A0A8J3RFS2_9ACTN|nr:hypothetical protein Mth01_38310 [Sphaerimonospora thailandensis]
MILRETEVRAGFPAGKVTSGFLPTFPSTLMPSAEATGPDGAAALAEGLAPAVVRWAVPQAAASIKGMTVAAAIAVRRRM